MQNAFKYSNSDTTFCIAGRMDLLRAKKLFYEYLNDIFTPTTAKEGRKKSFSGGSRTLSTAEAIGRLWTTIKVDHFFLTTVHVNGNFSKLHSRFVRVNEYLFIGNGTLLELPIHEFVSLGFGRVWIPQYLKPTETHTHLKR